MTINELMTELEEPKKVMLDVQAERLREPIMKNVKKSVYPLYMSFNEWIKYIHNER